MDGYLSSNRIIGIYIAIILKSLYNSTYPREIICLEWNSNNVHRNTYYKYKTTTYRYN